MRTFSDIVQETRELIHNNPAARRLPRGRFLTDLLDELQEAHDREAYNPSTAYPLKAVRDDAVMLANAREYDRGYQDGKTARSADEWRLSKDRKEALERIGEYLTWIGARPSRGPSTHGLAFALLGKREYAEWELTDTVTYLLGGDATANLPNKSPWQTYAMACEREIETLQTRQHAMFDDRMKAYGKVADLTDLVDSLEDMARRQNEELKRLLGGDTDGRRRNEAMDIKFIGQSVEYVGGYGDADTIAGAARNCTQTDRKGSAVAFVKNLVRRGHMSPVEFGFADFMIECDRAIQQELTRHRLFSFNIESTRWISYLKKPLRFVTKPPKDMAVPEEAVELLEGLCESCADTYEAMIALGAPRDYARKAFPLALASKVRMAGNTRTWLEMLPKRLSRHAHPEIREIAAKALSALADRFGGIYDRVGDADGH